MQETVIDDCTGYLLINVHQARAAENAVRFADYLQDQAPFPIQRIRTDNGTEFTSYKFRHETARRRIKRGPMKLLKPHLNRNVERVQQTALNEVICHARPRLPA